MNETRPLIEYAPGVYGDLFARPVGQRLWALLQRDDNLVRMATATALQRPAIEAIAEILLEEFGPDVLDDRVKQMIGHMVRQIMAAHGYLVDAQNVKITSGPPFVRGTRFRRPDDASYHLFQHVSNPRLVALTDDRSGRRLPQERADVDREWHYRTSFRGHLRGRVAYDVEDMAAAQAEIRERGYHRYMMHRVLRPPSRT